MSSRRLINTVVFMGSAKNVSPPWGGPARLGDGVLNWVVSTLKAREGSCGGETVTHNVTVFDPLDIFASGGALEGDAQLAAPHFFLKPDAIPPKMAEMAATIKAADCYIIVSAEYNHSVPPALLSLLGHFGGSNYAYKVSAIVTYSAGPWGGMRAAMALRPILSELGCLPISKLTGIPNAGDMFNADGTSKDPTNRMLGQLPSMLEQLEWFTLACMKQRAASGV